MFPKNTNTAHKVAVSKNMPMPGVRNTASNFKMSGKASPSHKHQVDRPNYKCGRCGQLKKGHHCPTADALSKIMNELRGDSDAELFVPLNMLLATSATNVLSPTEEPGGGAPAL